MSVERGTSQVRYRRLRTYFALTKHWTSFDPFFQSKADTYRSSSGAIIREHVVAGCRS